MQAGGLRRRRDPRRARLPRRAVPLAARRTGALDAYRGDTLEGRTRLLVEIVEEIRARCGADYPGRRPPERRRGHARRADARRHARDRRRAPGGGARRLPVDHDRAMRGAYVKDSSYDEGFALGLAEAVKQLVDVPVIVAGPDPPARTSPSGRSRRARPTSSPSAAACSPTRSGSTKARDGRVGQIRPCVGIVQDCRRYARSASPARSTPRSGARRSGAQPDACGREPRRVVVAGGGPAGLEAARVAAEAGHSRRALRARATSSAASCGRSRPRPDARGAARLRLLPRARARAPRCRRAARRGGHAATAVLADEPDLVVVRDRRGAAAAGRSPSTADATRRHRLGPARRARGGRFRSAPSSSTTAAGSGTASAPPSTSPSAARPSSWSRPRAASGSRFPHESVANVHRRLRSQRRPLPRRSRRVTRGRRHDGLARRRRSPASRPRRRPTSSSSGRACVSNDELLRGARRRGPGARRDRRLRVAAAPHPRRARRQPRAPAVRRRAARATSLVLVLMDVVVLAKYVPNPSGSPPEIGPDFRLRREEPDGGLDPSDEPGVEVAVRLVERARRAQSPPCRSGPEQAVRALQARARARRRPGGPRQRRRAPRGRRPRRPRGSLAAAIRARPFDLVLAGVESTDGATGAMPMALAELLGLPAVTFARQRRDRRTGASRSNGRPRRLRRGRVRAAGARDADRRRGRGAPPLGEGDDRGAARSRSSGCRSPTSASLATDVSLDASGDRDRDRARDAGRRGRRG